MIQNTFLTKYLALSIVVVSLLSVAGCNVFDREETIPAYLFIDEFTLETKNDVAMRGCFPRTRPSVESIAIVRTRFTTS